MYAMNYDDIWKVVAYPVGLLENNKHNYLAQRRDHDYLTQLLKNVNKKLKS